MLWGAEKVLGAYFILYEIRFHYLTAFIIWLPGCNQI